MPRRTTTDKESCSTLVYKNQMLVQEMCRACFEIDQHGSHFWCHKGISTKGICHRLHSEKEDKWKPYDSGRKYWDDYAQLQLYSKEDQSVRDHQMDHCCNGSIDGSKFSTARSIALKRIKTPRRARNKEWVQTTIRDIQELSKETINTQAVSRNKIPGAHDKGRKSYNLSNKSVATEISIDQENQAPSLLNRNR